MKHMTLTNGALKKMNSNLQVLWEVMGGKGMG